jgi:hypothetical protein
MSLTSSIIIRTYNEQRYLEKLLEAIQKFDSPYLILMEAKKDNFEEGWGQCLAELIAAQKINNQPEQSLYRLNYIFGKSRLWEEECPQ